jgi:hypothetical protein
MRTKGILRVLPRRDTTMSQQRLRRVVVLTGSDDMDKVREQPAAQAGPQKSGRGRGRPRGSGRGAGASRIQGEFARC